jgi:hypothetical protein
MDGGGLVVYVADCIGDEDQFCTCRGDCLVTLHNDRVTLNRVHAHGSALQYSHRSLLECGYDESNAPR